LAGRAWLDGRRLRQFKNDILAESGAQRAHGIGLFGLSLRPIA
jgi:hypothetical protein